VTRHVTTPESVDSSMLGDAAAAGPRVVALGGGHGLAASLSALRRITQRLTAVVTVADDGGSSGRLRRELGVLPPGDLRMALAALCGDDDWGRTWSEVVQHRFTSSGPLHDHAVGNLLIVALWQLLQEPVAGLDWVGKLLDAQGRVLPMAAVPLDIAAEVVGCDPTRPTEVTTVRGQVAVASTAGRVASIALEPANPPACVEAVAAIDDADWVILGPGSWFTSVLPHLLVPDLARAIVASRARRLVTLNLAPQTGETTGFSLANLVEVLAAHAPDLRVDVVLADPGSVEDERELRRAVAAVGAELLLADVATRDGTPRHDPLRLAAVFADIVAGRTDSPPSGPENGPPERHGRIASWR
jgi:uncharacterized cofD-like protein